MTDGKMMSIKVIMVLLFLFVVAAADAQQFDGFQDGTSDGTNTTIQVKIKNGTPFEKLTIQFSIQGGGAQVRVIFLDENGNFNGPVLFLVGAQPGDFDTLELWDDGAPPVRKDIQQACWGNGIVLAGRSGECVGACCFGQDFCQILTESECDLTGGLFQGEDTICDPDPCSGTSTDNNSWGGVKKLFR